MHFAETDDGNFNNSVAGKQVFFYIFYSWVDCLDHLIGVTSRISSYANLKLYFKFSDFFDHD